MNELKPEIHQNGIDYILVGDYYVPDLKRRRNTAPSENGADSTGHIYSNIALFRSLPLFCLVSSTLIWLT